MNKLPENAVNILSGSTAARGIVDNMVAAYWMHGRDNDTAEFLWKNIHASFADLAAALGYTITPKADEVAA